MKQLSSILKIFIPAALLSLGAAYAFAAYTPWSVSTGIPAEASPSGNFGLFLNNSTDAQFKPGSLGVGVSANPADTFEVGGNIVQQNTNTLRAKNSAGTIETWMWPRYSDNVMYTNFGSGGWNIRNNSSVSAIFIQNGGNVGIGTTNPSVLLDVGNATTKQGYLRLESSLAGTKEGNIYNDNTNGGLHMDTNSNAYPIQIDGSKIIMGTTGNGNVGIGTATPAQKLSVAGTIESTTGGFKFPDGTTQATAAGAGATLWAASGNNIYNTNTANVGIGTISPGAKLEVAGQVKITGGTPGANKVLTSDANGLATWATATSSPSGSGTTNYLAKWSTGTGLGNSSLFDDGTNVGIGTTDTGSYQGPVVLYDNASLGLSSVLTLLGATNSLESLNFAKGNTGTDRYTGKIWYNQGTDTMTFNTATTPKVTILGTGQVGIGTATPGAKLEVAGAALIYGMHIGHGTGMMQDPQSTAVGNGALGSSNLGTSNTAFGAAALSGNASGYQNTAVGYATLASNASGNNNTAQGMNALVLNTTGSQNTAHGAFALYNNTTASDNTAIGSLALYGNIAGSGATAVGSGAMQYANNSATAFTTYNTALGFQALMGSITPSANTGTGNTATGYQALAANTSGNGNTASGMQALTYNTTGYRNTASGQQALQNNTIGSQNTASGMQTLASNTSGSFNVADGSGALFTNVAGSGSTAIGYNAMYNANSSSAAFTAANTAVGYAALQGSSPASGNTGTGNNAIGYQALWSNSSGYSNVADGAQALFWNTTGWYNTAVGFGALINNTTGNTSTAVGNGALQNNTTGSNNTAIGYNAGPNAGALSNTTAVGAFATTTASNMVRIGNSAVTLIQGQVAYSYPSDIRLKENIENYTHGLDFITKLRPVTYSLKADATHATHQGFIAQEVEATGVPFYGIHKPANDKDFYSLSYSDFVVPLVNSVKELKADNDALSAKVDKLQAENDALLKRVEAIEAKLSK